MDNKKQVYAIWGTGEDGKACHKMISMIDCDVCCFFDSNELLWGTSLFDRPILCPDNIVNLSRNTILVIGSSSYHFEIRKRIDELLEFRSYLTIVSYEELCDKVVDFSLRNKRLDSKIKYEYTTLDRDVLYDDQIFSAQSYGGITRYFEEIINGISKGWQVDIFKGVNNSFASISKDVRILFDVQTDNPRLSLRGVRCAYNRRLLRDNQNAIGKYKIYHPTYYDDYNLNCYEHLVVTVHDMIHEIFGMDPSIIQKKKQLVHKADAIIAVSENTKRDVIDFLGIDSKKIRVIYHGNSLLRCNNLENPYRFPYILFVGNRSGYKNFETLIKAFSKTSYVKDIHIVCFGGGRFTNDELTLIRDLKLDGKIEQISGSDDLLASMYQGAEIFVYPSLYEGFGLPLLEAMHFATPIITSCISSMPEIGGSAALYFDPYSIEDLSDKLEMMLTDNELRNKYSMLGKERESNFSWGKCIAETKELYDSLLR